MDELVHHCLRELAFDGDLGKFIRLRDWAPCLSADRRVRTRCGLGFH